MSDLYSNDSGSKKKFLAPVLVMLLCMVSLSGAAFAYSATVDNTTNPVIIEGLTMELKDGDNIVSGPMFKIGADAGDADKLDVVTHIVDGKAANPNPNGKAILDGGATAEDYNVAHLATYEDGYYVEMYKNGTAAGFQTTTDYETDAALAAATAANGVFQLATANNYHLVVANGSDVAVNITGQITKTGALTGFEGVKHIYVTITGTGIDIVKDVLTDNAVFNVKTGLADQASLDLTIKAYVVLSDYATEDLPAVTGIVAAPLSFALNFTAATA